MSSSRQSQSLLDILESRLSTDNSDRKGTDTANVLKFLSLISELDVQDSQADTRIPVQLQQDQMTPVLERRPVEPTTKIQTTPLQGFTVDPVKERTTVPTPLTRTSKNSTPDIGRSEFVFNLAHLALQSVGQCIGDIGNILKDRKTESVLNDIERVILSRKEVSKFVIVVTDKNGTRFYPVSNMTSPVIQAQHVFHTLTGNKYSGINVKVSNSSGEYHVRVGDIEVRLVKSGNAQ